MTSAELLELFNDLTGRASGDVIEPAKKYTWLGRAQDEVISEVANIRPALLYPKVGTSAMPTLVTTDHNVFTFGVDDNDDPIVPFGQTQIYRRLTDIPDRPLRPFWDYLDEGTQIRLPRNRTSTDTLYYRGVVFPAKVSALVAPALQPGPANELTAIRAAMNFAEGGDLRNPALADRMARRWAQRFPHWVMLWKRQFATGGVITAWSARDLVTPLL